MTAVTLVEGSVPSAAIRRYRLAHYLALREKYEAQPTQNARSALEARYFGELERWVSKGGPVAEIRSTVLETCGKLVMLFASPVEQAELVTTRREDFHFRVDVCSKMTVNRVHQQPEFGNAKIVSTICDDTTNLLFRKLCALSGLR